MPCVPLEAAGGGEAWRSVSCEASLTRCCSGAARPRPSSLSVKGRFCWDVGECWLRLLVLLLLWLCVLLLCVFRFWSTRGLAVVWARCGTCTDTTEVFRSRPRPVIQKGEAPVVWRPFLVDCGEPGCEGPPATCVYSGERPSKADFLPRVRLPRNGVRGVRKRHRGECTDAAAGSAGSSRCTKTSLTGLCSYSTPSP